MDIALISFLSYMEISQMVPGCDTKTTQASLQSKASYCPTVRAGSASCTVYSGSKLTLLEFSDSIAIKLPLSCYTLCLIHYEETQYCCWNMNYFLISDLEECYVVFLKHEEISYFV